MGVGNTVQRITRRSTHWSRQARAQRAPRPANGIAKSSYQPDRLWTHQEIIAESQPPQRDGRTVDRKDRSSHQHRTELRTSETDSNHCRTRDDHRVPRAHSERRDEEEHALTVGEPPPVCETHNSLATPHSAPETQICHRDRETSSRSVMILPTCHFARRKMPNTGKSWRGAASDHRSRVESTYASLGQEKDWPGVIDRMTITYSPLDGQVNCPAGQWPASSLRNSPMTRNRPDAQSIASPDPFTSHTRISGLPLHGRSCVSQHCVDTTLPGSQYAVSPLAPRNWRHPFSPPSAVTSAPPEHPNPTDTDNISEKITNRMTRC